MATLTPSQWYNLEFLTIQPNPQYVPDPDNPGGRIVQPGWHEITTTEQLASVQQQIQDLAPVPQPQPDITQFQLDCIESYEILMEYAFSSPIEGMRGKAASLANMIARLTPDGLPIMVAKWNDIFQDADLDSNIPNLVNIAASNNHIPLVMNADFTLSIVM